jgi:hypothetical protein
MPCCLLGRMSVICFGGDLCAVAGSSESRKPVFRACPILLSLFPVSSFCSRVMLGSSILGVRSRATIVCRWSGVCLFVVPPGALLVAMDGLGPGVCAELVRLSLTFYTDALTRTHVNCMRVQSQVPTLLAWLHRSSGLCAGSSLVGGIHVATRGR